MVGGWGFGVGGVAGGAAVVGAGGGALGLPATGYAQGRTPASATVRATPSKMRRATSGGGGRQGVETAPLVCARTAPPSRSSIMGGGKQLPEAERDTCSLRCISR